MVCKIYFTQRSVDSSCQLLLILHVPPMHILLYIMIIQTTFSLAHQKCPHSYRLCWSNVQYYIWIMESESLVSLAKSMQQLHKPNAHLVYTKIESFRSVCICGIFQQTNMSLFANAVPVQRGYSCCCSKSHFSHFKSSVDQINARMTQMAN